MFSSSWFTNAIPSSFIASTNSDLVEKLNLYIIHLSNDEEGGKDYMLYKYDRLKKTALLIGTFKQCLFEK